MVIKLAQRWISSGDRLKMKNLFSRMSVSMLVKADDWFTKAVDGFVLLLVNCIVVIDYIADVREVKLAVVV